MIATIIILCLYGLNLGYTLAKDGEPSKPYNFKTTFFNTLLWMALLYWAGLFDKLFE